MEPIYEFENKNIKELRNNISHDCRLIEAQSIDFLLYLESKIGEEIDPVKKEKLSNLVTSFEEKLDANTKLKSELLDSYKEIDRTYTDLKKLGFDHLINTYNTNKLVNVDVKQDVVNEEYAQEEQPEMVEENVNEQEQVAVEEVQQPEQEKVEGKDPEQEEIQDEEKEEVNNDIDAIVAAAEAEDAKEDQEVDDNTEATDEEEKEEVEEASEEASNEPLIPTEEANENVEEAEEPTIVASEEVAEDNNEAVLIPTVEAQEEAKEEPTIVPSEETPQEEAAEPVIVPTEGEAVTEEQPELIIPAIDGSNEAVEEQPQQEEVVSEEAPVETESPEAVVVPDLEIPVVGDTATAEVQVTDGEELKKFVKSDNNPTSRILVTDAQYNALKASLSEKEALLSAREKTANVAVGEAPVTEEALVDNGLLPPEDNPQARIEQMMEQANQLYQSGDTAGAQALYDQISIENQKLQEQQAVR